MGENTAIQFLTDVFLKPKNKQDHTATILHHGVGSRHAWNSNTVNGGVAQHFGPLSWSRPPSPPPTTIAWLVGKDAMGFKTWHGFQVGLKSSPRRKNRDQRFETQDLGPGCRNWVPKASPKILFKKKQQKAAGRPKAPSTSFQSFRASKRCCKTPIFFMFQQLQQTHSHPPAASPTWTAHFFLGPSSRKPKAQGRNLGVLHQNHGFLSNGFPVVKWIQFFWFPWVFKTGAKEPGSADQSARLTLNSSRNLDGVFIASEFGAMLLRYNWWHQLSFRPLKGLVNIT